MIIVCKVLGGGGGVKNANLVNLRQLPSDIISFLEIVSYYFERKKEKKERKKERKKAFFSDIQRQYSNRLKQFKQLNFSKCAYCTA